MAKKYISEKRLISSGGYEMPLIILRPTRPKQPRSTPGILWIHGGGYGVGMASMVYMSRALRLVTEFGAVVISPEYRLSGKAAYPAALEDCYAALKYLNDNAENLGVASDMLMVGGESAGGGLTAALCMLARDRGEVNIAFQMPLYPMLDHRDTDSSRNNHGISWNTKRNHAAWKQYLRDVADDIPPYASPALQDNYSNLPPVYTFVGDREPFYCETMNYVENLRKAGVPAQVDIYPTGFHAFDMLLPFRKISRQAIAAFEKQFQYALENYRAPNQRDCSEAGNSNMDVSKITDIHGHYVFGVDDGAVNIEMSLDMIAKARAQGVRDIICASHSWGRRGYYARNLAELQARVRETMPDVTLHPGAEIACERDYMPHILAQVEAGKLPPLGNSRHLLLEFGTHVSGEEFIACVEYVKNASYIPVIAHPERYKNLPADPETMAYIRDNHIPLQVNAYSLSGEKDPAIRSFARYLLSEKLVTFIGSDAHRTDHRPPDVERGVKYILETCPADYAADILFRNADRLLLQKQPAS